MVEVWAKKRDKSEGSFSCTLIQPAPEYTAVPKGIKHHDIVRNNKAALMSEKKDPKGKHCHIKLSTNLKVHVYPWQKPPKSIEES